MGDSSIKYTGKSKRYPENANTILKESKIRELTLPDLRIIIKQYDQSRQKQTKEQNIKCRNKPIDNRLTGLDKVPKVILWRKKSFQLMVLEQLDIYTLKKESRHRTFILYKN